MSNYDIQNNNNLLSSRMNSECDTQIIDAQNKLC